MDITIKTQNNKNYKKYIVIAVLGIFALYLITIVFLKGRGEFSIDRDSVILGEVRKGKYEVRVRGAGLLVPDNIQWLSAEADAMVERVILKSGSAVRAGDIILKLSNPQLQQALSEQKWELEAMRAEFHAETVAQEMGLVQQESRVATAELDYRRNVAEFEVNEELVAINAVSRLDFVRARTEVERSKKLWSTSKKELEKMRENLDAQNVARSARLEQAKYFLQRLEEQVDNLSVKATMNGVVQEVPLEPGQRISIGANLAKLAQQDSLVAELQIPELQIRNVALGQEVEVDTRNNLVRGYVSRIDPAVVNGNVQIYVAFSEPLPDDARPDLSVDGEIKVAKIENTLYVERPLFAQSQSRVTLFKISEDQKFAMKTEVQTGYGSVSTIQIVQGLEEGDKIVISDPTRFETFNKIRIN
ncbi:efflux RND transporter periplasmic adaptor subunit [Teredinibacter turnerae]|uniref:efflux RND transporter periplasmic adaptor subunit n=1 Tax=Teredinibacter turnerae TaxID=2426 RepID=UPI0005F8227A|nr:HlyD family efflux transporter periplasmic adaptor subunit [Teredinibacter turnerae]